MRFISKKLLHLLLRKKEKTFNATGLCKVSVPEQEKKTETRSNSITSPTQGNNKSRR